VPTEEEEVIHQSRASIPYSALLTTKAGSIHMAPDLWVFKQTVGCSNLGWVWKSLENLYPLWEHSHQKLDQSPADSRVYDCLDFLIGAIRQVREGPASICQQVWVTAEEQARQYRQTRRDLLEAES
jgi:hypothetical protein